MYAVIFRAEIAHLDKEYGQTAKRLRDLALTRYGCSEFVSVTEGDKEIAISYWDSEDQIRAWKKDADHLVAQEFGMTKWYKSYRVQVVEIKRDYGKTHNKSLD